MKKSLTQSSHRQSKSIENSAPRPGNSRTHCGPGLLETTYEICLAHARVSGGPLARSGHDAVRQLHLPVVYKGVELEAGYRIDLLVDRLVVVEVKATSRIEAIHQAQLLSYLRLSGHQVGLLLNFNVRQMREGIKRLVMDQPAA